MGSSGEVEYLTKCEEETQKVCPEQQLAIRYQRGSARTGRSSCLKLNVMKFRRKNASSFHSHLRRPRPWKSAPQSWGTPSVSRHLSCSLGRSVCRRGTRLLLSIMLPLPCTMLQYMLLHLFTMLLLLFTMHLLLLLCNMHMLLMWD